MPSQAFVLNDRETIAFYGDSITAQNLFAAYVETFLTSRFPDKRLGFYNLGWGGNTTKDGADRFARDVRPLNPTLVITSFGANDAKWMPTQGDRFATIIQAQKDLAKMIEACGARQLMLTTGVVDFDVRPDKDAYNDVLAGVSDRLIQLAGELKLDIVEMFHPLRDLQNKLKRAKPGFTMIPDGSHPNMVGHLIIAYHILRRFSVPKTTGRIEISGGALRERQSVKVANLRGSGGALHFELTLPFIPFYVPPEARPALDFIPFQKELNEFSLRIDDWDRGYDCALVVDGREKDAAIFSADQLAKGVDLSLTDTAPWSEQGRQLWEIALHRHKKHYEIWRELRFESRGAVNNLPSHSKLITAQMEYVSELSEAMRQVAQPGTHRVSLLPAKILDLARLEVSPAFPYRETDFEMKFPPEMDSGKVEWSAIGSSNHVFDLGKHFKNPRNCVSYVRLRLNAAERCRLHLILGSDDGLAVLHDGRRVLSKDVQRGCILGDDEVDVELKPGANELLFRVTQFGGAYLLALKAICFGRVGATVVPALH